MLRPVVGGLGAIFQTHGNLAISLIATGIVAVLFQSLRERLQRSVNRLMYGERDDPYAVLARLDQRLEATIASGAVLPTIVETVAGALKLPYAAITVRQHQRFIISAVHGSPIEPVSRYPLVYQNEMVGELLLASRGPGESFSAADRHLLEDMARQRPTTPDALRNVSGVGERKLQLFGPKFLQVIAGYTRKTSLPGRVPVAEKPKVSTQLQTLEMFSKGMTIGEIATERQLTTGSIANHLVQLVKSGYDLNLEDILRSFVSPAERADIERAIQTVGMPEGRLKGVFDHLEGKYDYGKLTLVASLFSQ